MSVTKCPYCGVSVEPTDTVCTNCFWDLTKSSSGPQKTMMTHAQQPATDDFPNSDPTESRGSDSEPAPKKSSGGSRSAPKQKTKRSSGDATGNAGRETTVEANDGALPYRPRLRPPMAVLRVYDDDGKDAESFRIRTSECLIGRAEGDVVIPHEKLMSGKHATITCKFVEQQYRWYLEDLNSTNGTFLKIRSGKLQHNSEILIGALRYRFDAAPQGSAPDEPAADVPQRTMGWQKVSPKDLVQVAAALIRITPDGEAERFELGGGDQTVGSNAGQADVVISDDPMLGAAHVRLYQDEHKRWYIEDLGSSNGVWLSITKKQLDMGAQFQLGEQRFSIRFP